MSAGLEKMQTKTCDICSKSKPLSKFNEFAKYMESDSEKEVNICSECE